MANPVSILLAEDNAADAFLVQEALRDTELDFQLSRATDGELALDALRLAESEGSLPDLILLDLNLPKVSGHQLLTHIRRSERLRNIPVIIITSSDSQEDRSLSMALGVDRYFRKPSEYAEFLQLGTLVQRVYVESLSR